MMLQMSFTKVFYSRLDEKIYGIVSDMYADKIKDKMNIVVVRPAESVW